MDASKILSPIFSAAVGAGLDPGARPFAFARVCGGPFLVAQKPDQGGHFFVQFYQFISNSEDEKEQPRFRHSVSTLWLCSAGYGLIFPSWVFYVPQYE